MAQRSGDYYYRLFPLPFRLAPLPLVPAPPVLRDALPSTRVPTEQKLWELRAAAVDACRPDAVAATSGTRLRVSVRDYAQHLERLFELTGRDWHTLPTDALGHQPVASPDTGATLVRRYDSLAADYLACMYLLAMAHADVNDGAQAAFVIGQASRVLATHVYAGDADRVELAWRAAGLVPHAAFYARLATVLAVPFDAAALDALERQALPLASDASGASGGGNGGTMMLMDTLLVPLRRRAARARVAVARSFLETTLGVRHQSVSPYLAPDAGVDDGVAATALRAHRFMVALAADLDRANLKDENGYALRERCQQEQAQLFETAGINLRRLSPSVAPSVTDVAETVAVYRSCGLDLVAAAAVAAVAPDAAQAAAWRTQCERIRLPTPQLVEAPPPAATGDQTAEGLRLALVRAVALTTLYHAEPGLLLSTAPPADLALDPAAMAAVNEAIARFREATAAPNVLTRLMSRFTLAKGAAAAAPTPSPQAPASVAPVPPVRGRDVLASATPADWTPPSLGEHVDVWRDWIGNLTVAERRQLLARASPMAWLAAGVTETVLRTAWRLTTHQAIRETYRGQSAQMMKDARLVWPAIMSVLSS